MLHTHTHTHTQRSREQLKRWTSRRSGGDSGTNGATAAAQICWPCELMRGSNSSRSSSTVGSIGSDKKACELPGNGPGLAASTLGEEVGRSRKELAAGQLDRQLERQGHLAAAKIAKLKLKCKCCNERRTQPCDRDTHALRIRSVCGSRLNSTELGSDCGCRKDKPKQLM